MTEAELKKKSTNSKRMRQKGDSSKVKLKTLLKNARSFGFLESDTLSHHTNTLSLTTSDSMEIALGHAVLAMQCLRQITTKKNPILLISSTLSAVEFNLKETIDTLYTSLNNSTESKGQP